MDRCMQAPWAASCTGQPVDGTIDPRDAGVVQRIAAMRSIPAHARPDHTRLNTSVPLVPPNPNPFDTATSTLASRATFGT